MEIDLLCSQNYKGNRFAYKGMRSMTTNVLIRGNCRSLLSNILGGKKLNTFYAGHLRWFDHIQMRAINASR